MSADPRVHAQFARLERRLEPTHRFVRLTRDRLPALFEFFRRAYADAPPVIASANCSAEVIGSRWRWMNERYPGRSDDALPAWVALREGAIVGHVAALPVVVARGNATQPFSWARDLIVDREQRGRGLGAALILKLAAESPGLLLGGLNDEVRRMYRRIGFRDMGTVPFYVRPHDGAALLAVGGHRRLGALRGILGAVSAAQRAGRSARDPIAVAALDRFDARFDEWWASVEHELGAVVRRSSDLMNWRYREHPTHAYRCFVAHAHERIRGHLVIRTGVSRGLQAGFIVEVLARPRDTAVIDRLLDVADDELKRMRSDLAFTRATVSGTWMRWPMLRAGFFPAPSPIRWMIDPPAPAWADRQVTTWYLDGGDSDFDAL